MKTRTIRQTVLMPAAPADVYEALMSTRGHAAFTGAPARISPKVGGSFTAWGGYIHGRNLELERGRRIVQEWRPAEEGWPEDHYSIVTFRLSPVKTGTRIGFTHSGVPAEHAGHLSKGWKESYWDPMRRYFSTAKTRR